MATRKTFFKSVVGAILPLAQVPQWPLEKHQSTLDRLTSKRAFEDYAGWLPNTTGVKKENVCLHSSLGLFVQ